MPSSAGQSAQAAPAGGGQFAEYGGVNPDLEPDLAMALKLSMEEEANRKKQQDDQAAKDKPAETATAKVEDVNMT